MHVLSAFPGRQSHSSRRTSHSESLVLSWYDWVRLIFLARPSCRQCHICEDKRQLIILQRHFVSRASRPRVARPLGRSNWACFRGLLGRGNRGRDARDTRNRQSGLVVIVATGASPWKAKDKSRWSPGWGDLNFTRDGSQSPFQGSNWRRSRNHGLAPVAIIMCPQGLKRLPENPAAPVRLARRDLRLDAGRGNCDDMLGDPKAEVGAPRRLSSRRGPYRLWGPLSPVAQEQG